MKKKERKELQKLLKNPMDMTKVKVVSNQIVDPLLNFTFIQGDGCNELKIKFSGSYGNKVDVVFGSSKQVSTLLACLEKCLPLYQRLEDGESIGAVTPEMPDSEDSLTIESLEEE